VPRRTAHVVAEIEIGGSVVNCGVSRDASAKGLLLLSRGQIASGSEITLRLLIPGEKHRRSLQASVVRCEKIPPRERELWSHRIALSIVDPPHDFESLVEMLSAKARAG
jgi:hypothetical protein